MRTELKRFGTEHAELGQPDERLSRTKVILSAITVSHRVSITAVACFCYYTAKVPDVTRVDDIMDAFNK